MTNQTETQPEGQLTDAWRQALTSRRTQLAEGTNIPAAIASRPETDVSRRRFIVGSFWAGLGATLLGSVGIFLDFFYPRGVQGFGVPAGNVSEFPPGGDPREFALGQFWMVNLDPAETRPGGSGGGSGLLALWRKCPHLGCSVPWRGAFSFEGDSGWFRCPCHGSTYTKAGVRVYGPAPRSMDTMLIEIDDSGNIIVQTGTITPGSTDNPSRAIPI